jgi:NDP-sugar pyrophosphorylase family protein
VDVLLDAASEGERVFGYDATASEWIDVGTPDKLASAANLREDLRRGFG